MVTPSKTKPADGTRSKTRRAKQDSSLMTNLIRDVLDRLAKSPLPNLQPLNEMEFLQEMLVLANSADIGIDEAAREPRKRLETALQRLQFGAMNPEAFFEPAPVSDEADLGFLCQTTWEQFSAIPDVWSDADDRLWTEMETVPFKVLMVPRLNERADGSRSVNFLALPRDLWATLDWAACLLLDRGRGYGGKLCECRRCHRLFFEYRPATGRPRRLYCCDEHMQQANDEKGADRVAASREGISVAEWRRRKARKAK